MEKPLAVVTGASSGIGYELAKQFAEHGYDLVIAAEDAGLVEAKQACEIAGAQIEAVRCDLATYDGVEALYGKIRGLGRPVAAAAINAGVGVSGDFARQTELDDELDLIALNVTSAVHLAKRLAKDMVERGDGRILFTSSIAATMPTPFEAVYGASKAFLLSFAESLRCELEGTGVTVTALLPGATETNFFHRAGMDDTKLGQEKKDDPAVVARQGFQALLAGKEKVVAGSFKNKVMAATANVVPDHVRAEQHRKRSEPGSAHRP